MNRFLTLFLAALTLTSCEPVVRFEVPQPQGQSSEKLIPRKLIGEYSSLGDSSTLIVTPGQITKISISDISGPKSELDSAEQAKLKNDTTFSVTDGQAIVDVTVRGDSVFDHIVIRDTIFSVSRRDILKKFKGHYFLNKQISENSWRVIKLSKTKNGLALGWITKAEDMENLRELTETPSDTIYNFNPTRQQFKKFVKTKGFTDEDFYIKI